MKAIQQYSILGIAIILLSIAFLWDNANQRSEDLSGFVQQIEKYITDSERKVINTFKDDALLQRLVSNEYSKNDWKTFEEINKENYSLFIYKEPLRNIKKRKYNFAGWAFSKPPYAKYKVAAIKKLTVRALFYYHFLGFVYQVYVNLYVV